MEKINNLLVHYTVRELTYFSYLVTRAEALGLSYAQLHKSIEDRLTKERLKARKYAPKERIRDKEITEEQKKRLEDIEEAEFMNKLPKCEECGSPSIIETVNSCKGSHITGHPDLRTVLICTNGKCKHTHYSTKYPTEWIK